MSEFEWDKRKRESNLAKHGVDFEDVRPIFAGLTVEPVDSRRDYGEVRIFYLGEVAGRVFLVVYTWRGQRRRIISARGANARERRTYFANRS